MKKFYFNPTTPIIRAFDVLAQFRAQAKENGWGRQEIQKAIRSATSDGETIVDVAVKLSESAGLDKHGDVL